MSSDADEWFDRAEEELAALSEGAGDEQLNDAVDTVRTLVAVLDEVEDASEFVDASEIPEAVEFDELIAALEPADIPAAVRESDPRKAVRLTQLLRAVDLTKLWDNADVRELWRQKGEIEDAMSGFDDGGDGDEGDSLASVGAELEAALGDDAGDDGIASGLLEDDEGDEEAEGVVSGLLGDDEADGAVAASQSEGGDSSGGGMDLTPDALEGIGDIPQESKQTAIQRKAMEGIDEFRESLIDVHNELEGVVEENRGTARENREQGESSRNPVAYSTLPEGRSDVGSTVRYSTIPRETRHSTAPNRKRVYGNRFSTMRGGSDG